MNIEKLQGAFIEFHLPCLIFSAFSGEDQWGLLSGFGMVEVIGSIVVMIPTKGPQFQLWSVPLWGLLNLRFVPNSDPPTYLLSLRPAGDYFTGILEDKSIPVLDEHDIKEFFLRGHMERAGHFETMPEDALAIRESHDRWLETTFVKYGLNEEPAVCC